jgi:hypothetical protein
MAVFTFFTLFSSFGTELYSVGDWDSNLRSLLGATSSSRRFQGLAVQISCHCKGNRQVNPWGVREVAVFTFFTLFSSFGIELHSVGDWDSNLRSLLGATKCMFRRVSSPLSQKVRTWGSRPKINTLYTTFLPVLFWGRWLQWCRTQAVYPSYKALFYILSLSVSCPIRATHQFRRQDRGLVRQFVVSVTETRTCDLC